jgi:hypothetical protein
VLAFSAESTDSCLSAAKVWKSLKRRVSSAPRPGAGGGPRETPQKARRDQGEIEGCFGAEDAMRCDTWLLRTCKGGHRTRQTQGAPRVKVFRPHEDTLEACTMRGVIVIPL